MLLWGRNISNSNDSSPYLFNVADNSGTDVERVCAAVPRMIARALRCTRWGCDVTLRFVNLLCTALATVDSHNKTTARAWTSETRENLSLNYSDSTNGFTSNLGPRDKSLNRAHNFIQWNERRDSGYYSCLIVWNTLLDLYLDAFQWNDWFVDIRPQDLYINYILIECKSGTFLTVDRLQQ